MSKITLVKQFLLNFINKFALQFTGIGIDKKFPFLISLYEAVYARLQPQEFVTVSIPMNLNLKIDKSDAYLGMSLLYKGTYEPTQTAAFVDSISERSIVFDVGANVGYYSVIASSICTKGNVYSFEPDKSNFTLLTTNITLNNFSNITATNCAISDQSGELQFVSDSKHHGKSHVVEKKSDMSYTVPSQTIDEFCMSNNIPEINVLKIDVEGFEPRVLKGGARAIKASRSIVVFVEFNPISLIETGSSIQQLFDVIAECELEILSIIDEANKSLIHYSPQALEKILETSSYTNLILGKHVKK